jgi:1,4-alpha-glucan branching enzyme
MGEEAGSTSPFQFFTDHHGELADAVREGRRREFASFAAFADPERRAQIPDPNAAETFHRSRPQADAARREAREALYRKLLALRREHLVPRLAGAKAIGAQALGSAAVLAQWRLGDGAVWSLASNLGAEPCGFTQPPGCLVFGHATEGELAAHTTLALLEPPHG